MAETTMTTISSPNTGDKYTHIHHKSGLEILVCEMEGFSTTEAMFGTKYGSINTQFKTAADKDYCTVPEGIAHFLEHKLFENEDCDVFDLYAKTGANANAFTSFDKTCYFFSCSDNFKASLEILLSFVQSPYFTPESVAKEQGIIGQEIRMCDADPGWRVFFNMLCGLYQKHPVRIDIAGTIESIAQITDDLLYRCYRTFYNLHNMVLAIAGDVDEDEIMKLCDEMLIPSENKELMTIVPEEPVTVASKYVEQKLEVAVPMFNIGYKSEPVSNEDMVRCEVLSDMVLAMLADETSDFYKRLYDEGLINSAFSSETFSGDGFFVPIFGGESREPEKVAQLIAEEIERRKQAGFTKEEFETVRKAYYGSLIRSLGNPEAIAGGLIKAGLRGTGNAFSTIEAVASVTAEDAAEFLRQRFDPENCTLSVIRSEEQEDKA